MGRNHAAFCVAYIRIIAAPVAEMAGGLSPLITTAVGVVLLGWFIRWAYPIFVLLVWA